MQEQEGFNLVGTDFTSYIDSKKRNSILSRDMEQESFGPVLFTKNLLGWFGWKVLSLLTSVLSFFIAILRAIINLKTDTLQMYFWGRNASFGLFLQAVLVFIIGSGIFTGLLSSGFFLSAEANSDNVGVIVAEEQEYAGVEDVLVETGTLETFVPQTRLRIEVEKYIVKPGETLASVAEKYDVNEDSLRWANNMKAGDQLAAGKEISIPPGKGLMYVVQKNDNLDVIAAKFNASEQTIAEANWLDDPNDLTRYEGKEIFVPNGTMPQPTKAPARAASRASSVRVPAVAAPANSFRFLSWPVQGGAGKISQCPSGFHMAMDIASAGAGTPNLVAAAPGTVVYAGKHSSGYAWVVEINHGNGVSTLYAHMVPNSIVVKAGEQVERGQVLGKMGQSGIATGIHIHFEVSTSGQLSAARRRLVNPAAYMLNSYCGY